MYCIPPEHQIYSIYYTEYKNCYKKLIINHRIENVWKLLLSTTPGRGAPFLMLRFWRQNEVPISFPALTFHSLKVHPYFPSQNFPATILAHYIHLWPSRQWNRVIWFPLYCDSPYLWIMPSSFSCFRSNSHKIPLTLKECSFSLPGDVDAVIHD